MYQFNHYINSIENPISLFCLANRNFNIESKLYQVEIFKSN